jgi:two-component system, OmpR family, sensor histidine kinase MtrB
MISPETDRPSSEQASTNGDFRGPSSLEEFLALIAHEMNTPLSVVDMAAETALDSFEALDTDELRNLLEVVSRNVQLAMLLMNRMSLARDVEKGDVDLDLESVDLALLIRQSVRDLELVVLHDHPVELDLPDSLEVEGDATALREIVFNLLANASKYSDAGSPVAITLDRTGDRAVAAIRNHGRGVTPGNTEAIFDQYFQSDEGASGVGLGLFISRGLARAHGGDISVRPAADVGSEFRLELPAS